MSLCVSSVITSLWILVAFATKAASSDVVCAVKVSEHRLRSSVKKMNAEIVRFIFDRETVGLWLDYFENAARANRKQGVLRSATLNLTVAKNDDLAHIC